jgi:peptidoglycan/LPS O-acetylase OafA/YrhL
MLSGFVVSLGYGRQVREGSFRYGNFLCRRIWKLYPLHLLCLAFFLLVSGSAIDFPVVMNALLIQSWVPDPTVYFSCNGVSWFLSSLFFCYLIFPLAFRWVSIYGLGAVLAFYAVVCFLTPYDKVNAILYVNPLLRFVDFYIGMVLYKLYEKGYNISHAGVLEALLIVVLIMSLAFYPVVDAKFRNAPMFWLVLVPFILVFAKGQGIVSSFLRRSPMLMLASLSMPVYMVHQMTIGILLHRLPQLPTVVMLFICLLSVLVVSWLIDLFFLRQLVKKDNNLKKSTFILI